MIFFYNAAESVVSLIPYLYPRFVNYWFPLKQSLTACGKESPNCWIKSLRLRRSLIEPLAALSKTWPTKTTVSCALLSSKHGTIVVGSGSLFD